jgi:EAL domain-containing protein (putative c-di-GMP-specific phosphodiesterase class I)
LLTLQKAIDSGDIYSVFQPVVDLNSKTVYGYESLVRSKLAEYPNPPKLLAAAINHNFLGRLGRELRRMSVEGCPQYPLFLNIHPDEFDEGWLVRPDDSIMLHDRDVYLEITESVPLSHYRYCHSVLAEVRRRGVKIAVDDLGAGYSNLKYIADLAPDIVKLDRELIAGLTVESRLHRLVTSIVELCTSLGAKVVAEGIETKVELNAVVDTGAHFAQGYFLARPATPPPPVDWNALMSPVPG